MASGIKVLLIDDDERLNALVTSYLHRFGFSVLAVTHPEQGIRAIKSDPPEMIILDVMLTDMDGFAVCEQLRKNIRTAFLPILMLTASTDEGNRTKGYLLGTDDYMNKPFAVPELLARVSRLLRRTYGL